MAQQTHCTEDMAELSSAVRARRILILITLLACALAWSAGNVKADEDAAELAARGDQAYRRGDVVDALRWYRHAAESGHARSQARLAFVLDKAGEQQQAALWYRKAAEQGDAEGQHGLAMMYASGEGIERDPARMLHWLKRAASQDHVQSILGLARMLENGGAGIERDWQQALDYWQRAAQFGDHGAMLRLANAYRKGELGLAINADRAKQWQLRFDAATTAPSSAR